MHSINVQAVCSANCYFTNLVVRYPGSAHDSFVWNNCALRRKFVAGDLGNFFLLGDSGYAQRPWLMTPVRNAITPDEIRYNAKHTGTRFKIENAFGVWKSRFRCLDKSGGVLQFSPQRCIKIITATAVLHNIAVRNGVQLPPQWDIDHVINGERLAQQDGARDATVEGIRARDRLIAQL